MSGEAAALADEVAAYEADLADHSGVQHVVATASGITAIHTALHGVGRDPGDEVLVPALSVLMTAAPPRRISQLTIARGEVG